MNNPVINKTLRLTLINLIIFSMLFIAANIFSPYLFNRFLSAPAAHIYIPEGIRVLTQSSKASLVPKNYIGIAGDSYAFGYGDWLTSEMQTDQAQYSAGHILHNTLGVDVISFGQVGAGSIRGIVGGPISILSYLNKTWLYGIQDPETLLIFFYEGNDLSDNVEYIAASSKCIVPFDENKKYDELYFASYIQDIALNKNTPYQASMQFNAFDNLFLITTGINLYEHTRKHTDAVDYYKCSPYAWLGRTSPNLKSKTNTAFINGENVSIPDSLQGPSSDLSRDEMEFGFFSFEQSLKFIQKTLPRTRIGIVYIPSVLSSYQLASTTVSTQPFLHKNDRLVNATDIYKRSDAIQTRIALIADTYGVNYIDARPHIRAAATQQVIHGPTDWNHFNKAGYTALAEALVELVKEME